MKKYIGVKLIEAESMNKYEFYMNVKGEDCKEDNEEGYKVKYADGYESWSPKNVFDEAYRKIDNLTFGLALEAFKKGMCVAREGWNGKGMYVVKHNLYINENLKIDNDCLCLYNVKGQYNTWIPSITDIFAEDWMIVVPIIR